MKEINKYTDLDLEVQEAFKDFESYFIPAGLVLRGFRIRFKNGEKVVSIFSEWNDIDDFEIMELDSNTLSPIGEVIRTDLEDGIKIIQEKLNI